MVSKEQRWTLFTAFGKQYSLEYLNTLHLDHFCSTYLCDIFLILQTASFTSYADNNTPFVVRDSISNVTTALQEIGENFVSCFSNSQMKLNTDKYHLLSNSQETNNIEIGDFNITNSLREKLLGINFDRNVNLRVTLKIFAKKLAEN